MRLNYIYPTFF